MPALNKEYPTTGIKVTTHRNDGEPDRRFKQNRTEARTAALPKHLQSGSSECKVLNQDEIDTLYGVK